jgi:uncharacterized membrane protein (UPF0127 family)
MWRKKMEKSHGMLFLFEEPQPISFWMKNTFIPLDMLFFSKEGRVVTLHENAIPHDLTPIHSGADVIAVLELNAGISDQFGITLKSEIQHIGLDQITAVWPCDTTK